jgi:hypothetical protein
MGKKLSTQPGVTMTNPNIQTVTRGITETGWKVLVMSPDGKTIQHDPLIVNEKDKSLVVLIDKPHVHPIDVEAHLRKLQEDTGYAFCKLTERGTYSPLMPEELDKVIHDMVGADKPKEKFIKDPENWRYIKGSCLRCEWDGINEPQISCDKRLTPGEPCWGNRVDDAFVLCASCARRLGAVRFDESNWVFVTKPEKSRYFCVPTSGGCGKEIGDTRMWRNKHNPDYILCPSCVDEMRS